MDGKYQINVKDERVLAELQRQTAILQSILKVYRFRLQLEASPDV